MIKLISEANNPGCKYCKFQINNSPLRTTCSIKYDVWSKDPIFARCFDANKDGECTLFKPTFYFKLYSLFTGKFRCFAFGHKKGFDWQKPQFSWCKREGCNWTENRSLPMPKVKEPKENV